MIRSLLDRSVLALAALAVAGGAGIWWLVSWRAEAERFWAGLSDRMPTPEEEGMLELYELLPYLLSPAATTAFVAALIGLPIAVGAAAAVIARSRDDAG
ncbi:hypothetical protein ESO86_18425 [Agromyces binzhouensis]|uniref:Uncharacterized protein n=2 Tax=Agromyces binzhouensis TaxID=1817495 RepID=A0A4Q2J4D9_9MICO|nr:hypothetical protein ESO86_18425 [Agromyces binzhouensis]